MASFFNELGINILDIDLDEFTNCINRLVDLQVPYADYEDVTHFVYNKKQHTIKPLGLYISIILNIVKASDIEPQGYIAKAILEACETPEVKAIMLQNALGLDV